MSDTTSNRPESTPNVTQSAAAQQASAPAQQASAPTQQASAPAGSSSRRQSFRNWVPRFHEPVDAASNEMLRLQLDNLKLRFDAIDEKEVTSDQEKKWYKEIVDTFDLKELTWDDAYRLESEIGWLLKGERLRQEIAGRLRWAVGDGVPAASSLQTDYAALLNKKDPPADDNVFRNFLLQALEEIHWNSKRKHIRQMVRSQASRRTLILAVVALVIALAPYFFLPNVGTSVRPASFASLEPYIFTVALFGGDGFWTHFALYTSVTFGFLGALFSRLITLQKQWTDMALDELLNARSYHYIILRASIGVVGALVVYFFLQSGLVQGSVFPKFNELSVDLLQLGGPRAVKWPTTIMLPSVSLALLIMWSFIAGFSESLVPTVLSGTERQFGGAINAPPPGGH
jgi:hypothetical protein